MSNRCKKSWLLKHAKKHNIPNNSSMTKDELLTALIAKDPNYMICTKDSDDLRYLVSNIKFKTNKKKYPTTIEWYMSEEGQKASDEQCLNTIAKYVGLEKKVSKQKRKKKRRKPRLHQILKDEMKIRNQLLDPSLDFTSLSPIEPYVRERDRKKEKPFIRFKTRSAEAATSKPAKRPAKRRGRSATPYKPSLKFLESPTTEVTSLAVSGRRSAPTEIDVPTPEILYEAEEPYADDEDDIMLGSPKTRTATKSWARSSWIVEEKPKRSKKKSSVVSDVASPEGWYDFIVGSVIPQKKKSAKKKSAKKSAKKKSVKTPDEPSPFSPYWSDWSAEPEKPPEMGPEPYWSPWEVDTPKKSARRVKSRPEPDFPFEDKIPKEPKLKHLWRTDAKRLKSVKDEDLDELKLYWKDMKDPSPIIAPPRKRKTPPPKAPKRRKKPAAPPTPKTPSINLDDKYMRRLELERRKEEAAKSLKITPTKKKKPAKRKMTNKALQRRLEIERRKEAAGRSPEKKSAKKKKPVRRKAGSKILERLIQQQEDEEMRLEKEEAQRKKRDAAMSKKYKAKEQKAREIAQERERKRLERERKRLERERELERKRIERERELERKRIEKLLEGAKVSTAERREKGIISSAERQKWDRIAQENVELSSDDEYFYGPAASPISAIDDDYEADYSIHVSKDDWSVPRDSLSPVLERPARRGGVVRRKYKKQKQPVKTVKKRKKPQKKKEKKEKKAPPKKKKKASSGRVKRGTAAKCNINNMPNIASCTCAQLKDALREKGMKVSGRKAELIDRWKGAN